MLGAQSGLQGVEGGGKDAETVQRWRSLAVKGRPGVQREEEHEASRWETQGLALTTTTVLPTLLSGLLTG